VVWEQADGPEKWLLDDDLYARVCALIHDVTGLYFSDNSRYFLEKRLETRMEAIGGMSPRDYLSFLRFDSHRDEEWDQLISLITTTETYFMREERQLRCFQRDVLPILKQRSGPQKMRIWSAGCSTGEEPYTIAMLVRDAGIPEEQVEIFATDINSRALARAKEGVYGDSAFRAVDAAFKERWFTRVSPGKLRIKDEIRQRISFSRFNLLETDRYALLPPMDVIFCRNVIIYFDLESKVKVILRFFEKMRSGGFLMLGHSESLISITDKFKLIHLPGDLVYTKESHP
jgi:chemotaxis protein methyltransferase CheR